MFLFYNADLVEDDEASGGKTFAYIDDTNFIRTGPSEEENCQKLQEDFQRARLHVSRFSIKKFKLIHFRKDALEKETGPGIDLGGTVVQADEAVRFLGVILDRRLQFDQHMEHIKTQETPGHLGTRRKQLGTVRAGNQTNLCGMHRTDRPLRMLGMARTKSQRKD